MVRRLTCIAAGMSLLALMTFEVELARAQTPVFLTKWGTFGSGAGQFYNPVGVAVNSQGQVFVVDQTNNRVQKFSATGDFLAQWGGFGTGPGQLSGPTGIAVDGADNVYVSTLGTLANNTPRIVKYSSSGGFLTQWSGVGGEILQYPYGIAVDGDGNILVVDAVAHRVKKFTSSGVFLTGWSALGAQFEDPMGIAIDGLGSIYITYEGLMSLRHFGPDGTFLGQVGFNGGDGLAVDASNRVYLVQRSGARFLILDTTGQQLAAVGQGGEGDGEFRYPEAIAIAPDGRIYVADTANHRIQVFGALPTRVTPSSWGRVKALFR